LNTSIESIETGTAYESPRRTATATTAITYRTPRLSTGAIGRSVYTAAVTSPTARMQMRTPGEAIHPPTATARGFHTPEGTLARMRGLLLFGDTDRSAAMRHEVPVGIGDPFLFAEVDGRRIILTTGLEEDRIRRALPDVEILDYFDLGYREFVESGMTMAEAGREAELRAVKQLGLDEAIVPGDFPVALADRLRAEGVTVRVDEPAVEVRRRVKTPAELDGIRAAAKAAEAAMAAARDVLARAEAGADGTLQLDGKPLLAEDVRGAIRAAASKHGAPCPPDVIVSSVWQGMGHEPGSGPLPAGLPILIDLWPRDEESGCWADMARTFVAGEPAPEHTESIAQRAQLVRRVLDDSVAGVRPGVKGRELYDNACTAFDVAGYPTRLTSASATEEGFQYALGHGVGLEVHEAPGLGLSGHEPLVAGDVITLEPSLWDNRTGGVMFEDLFLVTETGSELLTHFPYDLTL
jgi:Xaa-Pro aminopeptidase